MWIPEAPKDVTGWTRTPAQWEELHSNSWGLDDDAPPAALFNRARNRMHAAVATNRAPVAEFHFVQQLRDEAEVSHQECVDPEFWDKVSAHLRGRAQEMLVATLATAHSLDLARRQPAKSFLMAMGLELNAEPELLTNADACAILDEGDVADHERGWVCSRAEWVRRVRCSGRGDERADTLFKKAVAEFMRREQLGTLTSGEKRFVLALIEATDAKPGEVPARA